MKKTLSVLFAFVLCACFARAESLYTPSEIDESIERALAYLAAVQKPDGSFPEQYGETGAISALAGMSFLAKGYTPESEKFGETIYRCADYILSVEETKEENGTIVHTGFFGKKRPGSAMYIQSICTLFLCEISGMVDPEHQRRLDAVLPFAVQYILDAQNVRKNDRDTGGWRYTQKSDDSDMSCSGWCLMALRSAYLNGAKVPDDAIQRAVEYVKRQRNEGEGSFVYQRGNNSSGVTLTGAGILCLELCGRHNEPEAIKAANYLRRVYKELANASNRSYGMYYTAQGLFQMGGEDWKTFEDWMYSQWIPRQRDNGSWMNEENSACYGTSLMVLAFSVPYRQLPIYQRDETVDED